MDRNFVLYLCTILISVVRKKKSRSHLHTAGLGTGDVSITSRYLSVFAQARKERGLLLVAEPVFDGGNTGFVAFEVRGWFFADAGYEGVGVILAHGNRRHTLAALLT